MRIARFVAPGPASPDGINRVSWGVVEGPAGAPLDSLTVSAIEGHPFADIVTTGERWALPDVRLLAPILPSKVVCIGKNYADHVKEMGGADAEPPTAPIIFLKPSTSIIGPGDAIRLAAGHGRVDHEAELALVIGRPARDVPREQALSHILGYTCGNDVSDRDAQKQDGQWTRAKGADSYCPIGPWIETELDASDVRVTATVNGRARQDGRTADLLHGIPELIAFMSAVMTLLPGDVILTGTPAGVGPITDGDTVTVEIEGIGPLTNPVRDKK